MRKWVTIAVFLAVASSGVAIGYYLNPTGVPPVKGYVEGKEIYFIHTEASDPKVAELLADMMGSPVLVVPSLAKISDAMVANVYVFTNGVFGEGPFKFQADIFDNAPDTGGYTPLRAINLVKWKNEGSARKLTSAAEVNTAINNGEITIDRPGVVVNMPLLTWPGGRR